MYAKIPSFHQLMQFALYLQYCGFSFPIFAIRNNKTLAIKEVSSWMELIIIFSVVCGQIYSIIINSKGLQISDIFNVFSFGMNITSVLFIIIEGWEVKTKSKLMKSIFEKIKMIDKSITLQNNQLNYLTVQLTIWSVAIIATAGTSLTTLVFYDTSYLLKVFGTITTLRLYVTPAVNLVQFFTLITLVRYYLEWIDKQLSKIRQLNLDGKVECKPYVTFRSHFRDGEDCRTANKIENIRKLYGCVHDLKRDINDVFNMRLWMDIVGTALKILFFIYFNLIIVKKNQDKIDDGSNFTQYYLQYWITFLLLKFLENIRVCGKITTCGKNLGVRVHEIFSSSYCENVRNELTTFSLELLHRDPSIKANNVFDIDYPLTASVLRGIVMQLIALLQINVPNNENNYIKNLYGSESTNITSVTQNNASEAPTTTI